MKKNTIIRTILIVSIAFLTSVGANAQTTPSNDTATYRLMKTKNQSGERVLYKDGEKIIIKEGESNPYGTSRWETDEQGNKVLVIRRNVAGDSTSQRMVAYKKPGDNGERVLYKNGEKIIVKNNDNNHLQEKGEWKTDEQGKRVFVIQKDSGKMLYVYPNENNSTSQGITSENIHKTSESLILYPNPTHATCNILYKVEKTGPVLLELVNMEGKTISTLLNEQKENGSYTLTIDLSEYSNGTYIVRYSSNEDISINKLLKIE